MLRYKFSSLNLISPLTRILIQAHNLLWAPTNISNILPKYFPHITQTFPHVITQLGPSQILPNISHILLPNLGSHKYFPYKPHKLFWAHTNTYHTITKIGPQNYIISIKTQTHLPCGQNPKSPTKLSYKIRCYSASLKHITTWHLKVRCYMAPLKPVATRHL